MRTLHLDVDSDTHAPRLVRHTLRTWLEPVECDDATGVDVSILVHELVSEAVHNDAARIRTQMIFDDGRLRIDLHDDRPPGSTPASDSLIGHLAAQTTDHWGRADTPNDTHTWAEILC